MSYKPRYLPPILWAALIFLFSSNPNPLSPLPEEAIPAIKAIRILGMRLDNIIWALLHIFLYAVLAVLCARALAYQRDLTPQLFWTAFAVTLLYGVSDEIHQVFVPGRGFQYYDFLMDGVGALLGLGVYTLSCIRRAQKAREESLLL